MLDFQAGLRKFHHHIGSNTLGCASLPLLAGTPVLYLPWGHFPGSAELMLLQGGKHSDLQLWTECRVEELKMCLSNLEELFPLFSFTWGFSWVAMDLACVLSFPISSFVLLMKKFERSSWACWLGHRRADIALCEAASNLVGGHSGTGRERVSQLCGHFHSEITVADFGFQLHDIIVTMETEL